MTAFNVDIRDVVDLFTSIIFLALLSWAVYKRYGKLIGISTFYFFGSSLIIFMNPFKLYNRVFANPETQGFYKIDISVSYVSAQAFVLGLLIFLFVAFADRELIKRSFSFLKYLSVPNAMFTYTAQNGGLFNGYTFDLTFAALFLPFFFESIKHEWERNGSAKMILDILCVLTILVCVFIRGNSMTPVLVTVLSFALYFFSRLIKYIAPIIAGLSITWIYAYSVSSPSHLMSRVYVWDKVVPRFMEKFNFLLGSGTGTYRIVGPLMQQDLLEVFYFAHNDPLQIFLEQGLIGIILTIAIIVYCYRHLKTHVLKVSLSLLILSSTMQYPLRVGIGFLFCLLFVRIAIEQEKDYQWLTQK